MKVFTGNKQLIQQKINELAKENNMGVKFSKNIFYDLQKQYGLFYKPSLLYFIFSAEYNNKESVTALQELTNKSKVPIVCIIEEELDKRSCFYKTYNKQIETIGETQKEKSLDEKVQDFYKNISTIKNIQQNEAVSFLYQLFYNFRHREYKHVAGYCINLVLTGKVKTELILKVFLSKL